jgi:uncharacterized protein (DUF1684 family)
VRKLFPVLAAGLAAASIVLCAAGPSYRQKVEAARRHEAEDLVAPGNWLSLVALQPLDHGDVTVGSAADNRLRLEHGAAHALALHMAGDAVIVTAADPALSIGGKPARAGQSIAKNQTIAWGDLTATIIRRTGNRTFLRVADTQSPNRKAFHGLSFYPVDSRYRVTAKWMPYVPPRTLRMGTVTGDVLLLPAPGYAEFSLSGTTVRLEPYPSETGGLSFLFRDGTGLTTTYGAGRELEAERPSNGLAASGTVVLDFNLATNPPCAYTGFATCPLATKENRFPLEIPAGEKRYHD